MCKCGFTGIVPKMNKNLQWTGKYIRCLEGHKPTQWAAYELAKQGDESALHERLDEMKEQELNRQKGYI